MANFVMLILNIKVSNRGLQQLLCSRFVWIIWSDFGYRMGLHPLILAYAMEKISNLMNLPKCWNKLLLAEASEMWVYWAAQHLSRDTESVENAVGSLEDEESSDDVEFSLFRRFRFQIGVSSLELKMFVCVQTRV